MSLGRPFHIAMLPMPDVCCHGSVVNPLTESSCVVCFLPALDPDLPSCENRCLSPTVRHEGSLDACPECQP